MLGEGKSLCDTQNKEIAFLDPGKIHTEMAEGLQSMPECPIPRSTPGGIGVTIEEVMGFSLWLLPLKSFCPSLL